ncbi:MAG: M56 family metallopeptidase [Acidimicrobiales bacterium]
MRLDSANRAFVALVAVAAAPYVALGLFGCGLLSYLAWRVAAEGPGVVTSDADLRPAVAFFAVISAGTVLAVRSLLRQHAAPRRLADHVRNRQLPLAPCVEDASERAGLAGRVDVVESPGAWSFVYGLSAPRVVVSAELAASASPEELDAVLAHERYHVRNLDPLKVVLARAFASAFFFLPVLRHLRARYLAGRELAADRRALRTAGRRPLAAALYRVVAGPGWPELATAAAIGGEDLLEVRLTQLETGKEPPLDTLPRLALVLTALGLALLVTALMATVASVGGPGELMDMDAETGNRSGGLAVVGALACGVAWVVGGVALYRRFAGGIDTNPPTIIA